MQSDTRLVFDHYECVQFNSLLKEPHWNSYISGNEP